MSGDAGVDRPHPGHERMQATMTAFRNMRLSESLVRAISERGYEVPTEIQAQGIAIGAGASKTRLRAKLEDLRGRLRAAGPGKDGGGAKKDV